MPHRHENGSLPLRLRIVINCPADYIPRQRRAASEDAMLMSRSTFGEVAKNLILARLLVPGSRPAARGAVQKSLAPLFSQRLTAAEWRSLFDSTLECLIAAGLLSPQPLSLTAAGREHALRYWQIDRLPAKARWETLKRDFLVPRVLGLS